MRPALAEHLRQPGPASDPSIARRSTRVVAAHEHVGDLGERRSARSAGAEARVTTIGRVTARAKNGCPGSRSSGEETTATGGCSGRPRDAPRGIRLVDPQPAVALDPDGAGADEHHVGERAQHLHREPVVLVAEAAAAALERDRAVEARDEVHAHARRRAVGQRVRPEQRSRSARRSSRAHRLCSR